MANAKSLCYYYDRYFLVSMDTSNGKCSLSNATNIRSNMKKIIITGALLVSLVSFAPNGKKCICQESYEITINNLRGINYDLLDNVMTEYREGNISKESKNNLLSLIDESNYNIENNLIKFDVKLSDQWSAWREVNSNGDTVITKCKHKH